MSKYRKIPHFSIPFCRLSTNSGANFYFSNGSWHRRRNDCIKKRTTVLRLVLSTNFQPAQITVTPWLIFVCFFLNHEIFQNWNSQTPIALRKPCRVCARDRSCPTTGFYRPFTIFFLPKPRLRNRRDNAARTTAAVCGRAFYCRVCLFCVGGRRTRRVCLLSYAPRRQRARSSVRSGTRLASWPGNNGRWRRVVVAAVHPPTTTPRFGGGPVRRRGSDRTLNGKDLSDNRTTAMSGAKKKRSLGVMG